MSQPNILQPKEIEMETLLRGATPRDMWRRRVEAYIDAGNSEESAIKSADRIDEEEDKRFDALGERREQ